MHPGQRHLTRPGLTFVDVTCLGISTVTYAAALGAHRGLWSAPFPRQDPLLYVIKLDFAVALIHLTTIAGYLLLLIAWRRRLRPADRWGSFVVLAWLGRPVAGATLVLFQKWWSRSSPHTIWPSVEAYGERGELAPLALALGAAALFLLASRQLFPGGEERDGAAQQADAPDNTQV